MRKLIVVLSNKGGLMRQLGHDSDSTYSMSLWFEFSLDIACIDRQFAPDLILHPDLQLENTVAS